MKKHLAGSFFLKVLKIFRIRKYEFVHIEVKCMSHYLNTSRHRHQSLSLNWYFVANPVGYWMALALSRDSSCGYGSWDNGSWSRKEWQLRLKGVTQWGSWNASWVGKSNS